MNAANLICLRHQDYNGTTPPTLSCKTCCHIFVSRLREQAAQGKAGDDGRQWLAKKAPDGANTKQEKVEKKSRFSLFLEGL
jgi:hypothetical protein